MSAAAPSGRWTTVVGACASAWVARVRPVEPHTGSPTITESRPSATVHVGLDVHAASIRLAASADELLDERTLPHDPEAVAHAVSRWAAGALLLEAGPTGYGLARHLRARGIVCDVVARGLVPVRPGDRVKTDRRDARKLARLDAGGLLEAITVPSEQVEALRDLVRAREAARVDQMRDRHRMSKFLLRHGLRMPNKSWGVTRRKWLGSLTFTYAHQQQAFQTYRHAFDLVDRRIEALEPQLDAAATNGPWRELVARLRCLRGVDTLTALGLVAEIGSDWSRFKTAEQFMSYVGLVPSECSSGQSRRQGSITKAGNGHVRRLLIEARGISANAPASARSSPASAAKTRSCSSAPGAPSNACTAGATSR